MIELSPATVFFVPLVAALGLIFAVWAYYGLVRRQRVKPDRSRLYRCQICEHVYLDGRDVPLARCPRCGCLNEAVKR